MILLELSFIDQENTRRSWTRNCCDVNEAREKIIEMQQKYGPLLLHWVISEKTVLDTSPGYIV